MSVIFINVFLQLFVNLTFCRLSRLFLLINIVQINIVQVFYNFNVEYILTKQEFLVRFSLRTLMNTNLVKVS